MNSWRKLNAKLAVALISGMGSVAEHHLKDERTLQMARLFQDQTFKEQLYHLSCEMKSLVTTPIEFLSNPRECIKHNNQIFEQVFELLKDAELM